MNTEFTMLLAGFSIHVTCLHPQTERSCQDYLTDLPPQLHLQIQQADIDRERKEIPEDYPDAYLERVALLRKAADTLLPLGMLFFHACCVCVDGQAYLFAAPSGTGKSTHAGLWMKNIPGCWILNGDKPFIGMKDGQATVFGTPWLGKEGWGQPGEMPLTAICLLERGEENLVEPITMHQALPKLLIQSYHPDTRELFPAIRVLSDIAPQIRFYRLQCNMEDEAALIAYREIHKP